MLNTNSIEDRISAMITEFTQTTPQKLPYESSLLLKDTLGLESLALVSVILRMGDEFQVDITEFVQDLSSIITVGDLYFLAQKLQKNC